jgi:hypothetical protein
VEERSETERVETKRDFGVYIRERERERERETERIDFGGKESR